MTKFNNFTRHIGKMKESLLKESYCYPHNWFCTACFFFRLFIQVQVNFYFCFRNDSITHPKILRIIRQKTICFLFFLQRAEMWAFFNTFLKVPSARSNFENFNEFQIQKTVKIWIWNYGKSPTFNLNFLDLEIFLKA